MVQDVSIFTLFAQVEYLFNKPQRRRERRVKRKEEVAANFKAIRQYQGRSLANCAKINCYIMSGRLPIIRSRDTARLTLSVYPRYI
jgi:hypothetical protein